jgi:hypothetical protein
MPIGRGRVLVDVNSRPLERPLGVVRVRSRASNDRILFFLADMRRMQEAGERSTSGSSERAKER